MRISSERMKCEKQKIIQSVVVPADIHNTHHPHTASSPEEGGP